MTIRRLMIANRGEIARRIIVSCQRLGIETVLAASEIDLDSVPARLADSVILLGPSPAIESYLDVEAVIAAAKSAAVDAIHPGYGFLAENPALAKRCDETGIIFVGATVSQLDNIGDKLKARKLAIEAGLPLVPGEQADNAAHVEDFASRAGLPIVIKATAGGGGKGMTRIDGAAQIAAAFPLAQSEAQASFGDERLYVEKFIDNGRHVEVQVLGDGSGVIHLGDRDCSTQRRYQKLIEEAPAPNLDPGLRNDIREAAVRFAQHCEYRGLGTVEFLVDTTENSFWFLEMNARIQVEHPVTEAISGIDMVAEQIAVAGGESLSLTQNDVVLSGHAIECRINAEDPIHDFMPSPGTVTRAVFPAGDGLRVDTHIETGSLVPPHYDSLVAKVVAFGEDRRDALRKLRGALANCSIEGVATNLQLQHSVTGDARFVAGGVGVGFLEQYMSEQHG